MRKENYAIRKAEHKRPFPLYGEIKIVQIYEKKIQSKHAPVTVFEIGRGIISFHSDLLLPVHEHIVWSMQIQYKGRELTAEVVITGFQTLKSGYLYEARWIQEATVRTSLHRALRCWIYTANMTMHKAIERYAIFDETSIMNKKFDVFC